MAHCLIDYLKYQLSNMLFDLSKEEVINLISTIKPDIQTCIDLTETGLMEFCGNQHNEDWRWNKIKLNEFGEYQLKLLYIKYSRPSN